MKFSETGARPKRSRTKATPVGLMLLGLLVALTLTSSVGAAATAVPLNTASTFAVLAGSGTTDIGPTTINGDMGTYPTPAMTVTGSETVNGTKHPGDAVALQAQTDLTTAYTAAAGEGPTSPIVADLGGQTLPAGVYNSGSTIGLTGTLTLDGGGDPNSVFVFQAGSGLTVNSASSVNMINGAQSCNVFWQVGSSATLFSNSTFRGTIIALTSIVVDSGVTIDGRVLARNGDVTLDNDTISVPSCASAQAGGGEAPSREIYCDPSGKAYDLVIGQNLQPPYNTLGLVDAYVDPVTGSKSCNFPAVLPTPTATTPTATTPTATTPTPTPVPPKPKPKPKPKPVVKVAAVKAVTPVPTPSPARHPFGLTG